MLAARGEMEMQSVEAEKVEARGNNFPSGN